MEIIKIDERYYCCAETVIEIPVLFKKVCKKNQIEHCSFAGQFISKLLISLFQYAENLNEEYSKYYSDEYDSFDEYLYKKRLLHPSEIKRLLGTKKEFIYFLEIDWSNYNIKTLMEFDDDGLEDINRLLE